MPDHADEFGKIISSASAASDGTGGFGAAFRRFISAGVYNGDFVHAPVNASNTLDDAQNQLPYWSATVVSGTDATSNVDTSSASGRVIHFTVTTAGGGATTSITQVVPVSGARGQSWTYIAIATFINGSGAAGAQCKVTTSYLQSDGVTLIATSSANIAPTAAVTDVIVPSTVPANAYYVRVTVGLTGDAGSPALTVTDLTEVRLLAGPSRLGFAESTTPATYSSGYLEQVNGVLNIAPTQNATLPVSPSMGVASWGRRIMKNSTGTQTLIAGTAIVATSEEFIKITAAGPITLTGTPTIANGDDGQKVTILNTGANAITLQDQGTLANSNLRLSAATIVLGTRDSLVLLYDTTIADWVQIGQTNVI